MEFITSKKYEKFFSRKSREKLYVSRVLRVFIQSI